MAKDYGDYDYRYSDSKGPYGVRRKGGRIFIVRPGGGIENATMVGGKIIPRNNDRSLAEDMLDSGRFDKNLRQTHRNQKERDEKEEERLLQEGKEKNAKNGYDIKNLDKWTDKMIDNVDKYDNYNNTKNDYQRQAYDEENKKFEKSLEKYDDESNKDFLRRGKLKDDFDSGKIGEREYNRRSGELDRRKMERDRKEEGPLREKERENKARKELEEARERQDEEDYKNRKDAFDYSREEVTKAYETMRNKMQTHMDNNDEHWSAKEYTNAEFLAHLEDANWHGEMKQLREANLTPEQLTEIKDKTTLSSWGVGSELTGKENVQKMIDSVKNKSTNETNDKYVSNSEIWQMIADKNKSTNETMNNAIREKASKSNTIPRDYEKITYTQKIDTNAGKKGDKFELYKNEYGETEAKNLRTGETYQANMSMMKSPEAVEINDVVKKQTSNKILNDSQLRKMKWEDVVKANTDYFSEKSVYDFEGGRQGKYKYEDGWRDNGGAGVIKQSDLDRLIDKEDWERANKGYGRKYDSVDEAIADKDSALNQYIRDKANEKKAYRQYLKDHPNSKMSLKEFRNMKK